VKGHQQRYQALWIEIEDLTILVGFMDQNGDLWIGVLHQHQAQWGKV
jgi:hypothetical protein